MCVIDDGRRTLAELRTLHVDLEPDLRDVIVEGRKDVRLYSSLLKEAGIPFSRVFAVDDRVDIEASMVLIAGGEVGARGRVIGLAAGVGEWEAGGPGITCIVDKDRDCLHPIAAPEGLLLTDFASVEGYVLQDEPFGRLLSVVLGRSESAHEVLSWLLPTLNEVFLVRVVLHEDGPGIPLIPKWLNCFKMTGGVLTVDSEDLIHRSLNATGMSAERGRLVSELEKRRHQLPADPRIAVRGHDIAPALLLGLGMNKLWSNPDLLEAAIAGSLRPEDFDGLPLLNSLRARLSNAAETLNLSSAV